MAGSLNPLKSRFHIAYLVLAVVLGAGAGLLVVMLGRSSTSRAGEWSSWEPAGRGVAAMEQIADRVSARYRLPSGKQLVGVIAQLPKLQPQPQQEVALSTVAISTGRPDERQEDIEVFRTTDSYMYILCGIGGEQCAIPEGKPSAERAMLLRREGLELALYTFRYDEGAKSVVMLFPPPPGQSPTTALFFRRADYEAVISRPLEETLPPRRRLAPGTLPAGEQRVVRELTLADPVRERFSGIYTYQFQQAPDGTALMVLSPIA